VVISIIALLLSILMPSLQKAKLQAQKLICSNAVKQWNVVSYIYAASNNDSFPLAFLGGTSFGNYPGNYSDDIYKFNGDTYSYLEKNYNIPVDQLAGCNTSRKKSYTDPSIPTSSRLFRNYFPRSSGGWGGGAYQDAPEYFIQLGWNIWFNRPDRPARGWYDGKTGAVTEGPSTLRFARKTSDMSKATSKVSMSCVAWSNTPWNSTTSSNFWACHVKGRTIDQSDSKAIVKPEGCVFGFLDGSSKYVKWADTKIVGCDYAYVPLPK
jgi:type II secretory pathway pseudopilin PulG